MNICGGPSLSHPEQVSLDTNLKASDDIYILFTVE